MGHVVAQLIEALHLSWKVRDSIPDIDVILPAALWHWVWLSLQQK